MACKKGFTGRTPISLEPASWCAMAAGFVGADLQLTDRNPAFSIYDFNLFEANFWDAIPQNTVKYPIAVYQEFWGVPYNKQAALDDYADIDKEAKLAYIIATAERVRLQHVADHSGWNGSKALGLGYWSLAADIARFLEIEAKRGFKTAAGAAPQDTLLACLEQSSIAWIQRVPAAPPCRFAQR
jgi:hypothetical protein